MNNSLKTISYTLIALIAFAANSVLCRLALKDHAIDPSSFTVIRLLAGVAMFGLLLGFKSIKAKPNTQQLHKTTKWPAILLFVYAITFSWAYLSVETGTGALVLFGAVQLTMILASLRLGNRLRLIEWCGISLSFLGLVYLVWPNLATPSMTGLILMAIAGIAWGLYSVSGRGVLNPSTQTAFNFTYTLPLVALLTIIMYPSFDISWQGVLLGVLSGAFASALGYTIWFIALGYLSVTEAAVVQLSVPVIAAFGGVIFVSEPITLRLMVASALVLSGILVVLLVKKRG
ncbi:DMT family transporter [Pseudoalteromonas tunicata]|uniref:DMT family transporter n=1 Tax=Pseudoalteromonas tunicata TaxID=314281 RepID=UPI00273F8F80|nr:DMT family transporter [Pseudoalteromonas tunicata]MDP5211467.1 DMT family transporter [Pseudoalteromonas tunicata]